LGRAVACDYDDSSGVDGSAYKMILLVATANALLAQGFIGSEELDRAVEDGEGEIRYMWVLLGDFEDPMTPVCAPDDEFELTPVAFRALLDVE
jgi:hypothetical protein